MCLLCIAACAWMMIRGQRGRTAADDETPESVGAAGVAADR
jgi:hypothetical protein